MLYIISIGIFQSILSCWFLWQQKVKDVSERILVVLLLCIAAHLTIKFVIYNFVSDADVRFQMNTFVGFSYAPLLYLFTRKKADNNFNIASKWYLFIPLLLLMLGYFSVASILFAAPSEGHRYLHIYNQVSLWLMQIAAIYFSTVSLYLSEKRLVSKVASRRLIRYIACGFLVMSVVSLVATLFAWHTPQANILVRSIVYGILTTICFLILKYRSGDTSKGQLADPAHLTSNLALGPGTVIADENILKKKAADEALAASIYNRLKDFMEQQELYRDADLSLDKLSVMAGYPKQVISETLNRHANKSFYQFLNEYRVQYVLKKLVYLRSLNADINFLPLAYEAGFNSKSSFNRYFKDYTGRTPTAYYQMNVAAGSLEVVN